VDPGTAHPARIRECPGDGRRTVPHSARRAPPLLAAPLPRRLWVRRAPYLRAARCGRCRVPLPPGAPPARLTLPCRAAAHGRGASIGAGRLEQGQLPWLFCPWRCTSARPPSCVTFTGAAVATRKRRAAAGHDPAAPLLAPVRRAGRDGADVRGLRRRGRDMSKHASDTLYRKVGRRYVPAGVAAGACVNGRDWARRIGLPN